MTANISSDRFIKKVTDPFDLLKEKPKTAGDAVLGYDISARNYDRALREVFKEESTHPTRSLPAGCTPLEKTLAPLAKTAKKVSRFTPPTEAMIISMPGLDNDYHSRAFAISSQDMMALAITPGIFEQQWVAENGIGIQRDVRTAITHEVYLYNFRTSEFVPFSKSPVDTRKETVNHVVEWLHDGNTFALGRNRGDIFLYDLATRKKRESLVFRKECSITALWGCGPLLYCGDWNGKVALFDTRDSKKPISTWQIEDNDVIHRIALSPNQRTLAVGTNKTRLALVDARQTPPSAFLGEKQPAYSTRFLGKHKACIKAIWISDRYLVSGCGSQDRRLSLWDIPKSECLDSVDTGSQICTLLWSEKRKTLVTTHGFVLEGDKRPPNTIHFWQFHNQKFVDRGIAPRHLMHKDRVLYSGLALEESLLVTGSPDETLRYWPLGKSPKPKKDNVESKENFKPTTIR